MNRPPDETFDEHCPRAADLPALLQDELSERRAVAVRSHLRSCPACAEEMRTLEEIVGASASPPVLPPHPDLAPSILAALPDDAFGRRAGRPRLSAAWSGMGAAAAVLLVMLLTAPQSPQRAATHAVGEHEDAVIDLGLAWLVGQQQDDGLWIGGASSGREDLTGLCLSALAGGDLEQPALRRSADRAARALLRSQSPNGRMGPAGPRGTISHARTTWALVRLYSKRPWQGMKPCIDRALAHLLAIQGSDGAWPGPRGNTGAQQSRGTRWALEALRSAQRTGWPGLASSVDAALAWLARTGTGSDPLHPLDARTRRERDRLVGLQDWRSPFCGSWSLHPSTDGRKDRISDTAVSLLVLQAPTGNLLEVARVP